MPAVVVDVVAAAVKGQGGRGGRGPPPPPPPPPPPRDEQNPSARRATSSERATPAPAPSPEVPAVATANQFAGLDTCQYVDNEEIPSDPDDDAEFEHEFSMVNDNSKPSSTDYFKSSIPRARRVKANHVALALSSRPLHPKH